MIEGIKATVSGAKLRELCVDRAAYHRNRADECRSRLAGTYRGEEASKLESELKNHLADSKELSFISDHLKGTYEYRLCRDDLVILGLARQL